MEFIKFLLQISWKQMVISIVAGLVSGCGNSLLISLINREVHQGNFAYALNYFIALAVSIVVTSIVAQFMIIYLSQNAIYELRLKLSQNILSSPLEHLEQLKDSRLLVTLTEDVHTLTHAVSAIPSLCIDLATVVGCFVYFAWLSSSLFVLTIVSTVSTIWFIQNMLNKAQFLFFKSREEDDNLFKHFQSILTGTKELKLNRARRQAFIKNSLDKSVSELRQLNTSAMKSFVVANGFGQSSQFISLGFVLFILPLLVKIPLSTLANYVLVGTFIALPMQNLLNRIPELVRGNVSLRKIERMKLSLESLSETEPENVLLTVNPCCHLRLQDVTYRYRPQLPPFSPDGSAEGHPPFPPDGSAEGHPPFPPDGSAEGYPPFPPNGSAEGHPPFPPNGSAEGHPPFPPNGSAEGHPPFPPNGSAEGHPPFPPNGSAEGHPLFPPNGSAEGHPDQGQGNGLKMPPPRVDEKGFLLGPITLSLQPGELVFIIGGNGSGKSTLSKLIAGLYGPQSGAIFLDNKRITQENVEWYRQHFSAVFSDFYLFDSCLGFSDPNLDQEVENYLKELQIAHKVKIKNGVFSTTSLSQGQQKRLALLIAYLEDRPIYLFDEWASGQDPRFREIFYTQMLPKLKERNKIVIVITHDDKYFHLADKIVKLDYGKIEEIEEMGVKQPISFE